MKYDYYCKKHLPVTGEQPEPVIRAEREDHECEVCSRDPEFKLRKEHAV